MTTVGELAEFLIDRLAVLAEEQGEAQIVASEPGDAPAVGARRRVEMILATPGAVLSDAEKFDQLYEIAHVNGLGEDPHLPSRPLP